MEQTIQKQQAVLVKNQHSAISLADSGYLRKLSKKLDFDEMLIIEKKYIEPRINTMSTHELLIKVTECLKRIHIITGWNLPDDKEYMKLLIDELLNKLKEDFSTLNFSEILFAFRKNGVGIKDWGKNMNLDLVCNVLAGYCDEREELSRKEEMIGTTNTQQKIYTDEEITNMRRAEIEMAFQAMKKGYIPIVHIYFEKVLIEDNILKGEENIHEFFVRVLNSGVENIYIKNE